MALTEVIGETRAAAPDARDDDALEREVLESEAISAGGEPDELLSAMTRTLAPGTLAIGRPGPGERPTAVDGDHNSGEPDDRSGDIIHERYELVRQLGKGGMGTVYIARHTTLPKTFAVKVLNARYAKRQDIAERFLQEAKAVSLIDHENVVSVVDFGREDDGAAFLVMEHLRGESLSTMCKREAPLAWSRVCHIMSQLCRALQAAHHAGIVHRDIKPENVLRVGRHDDPDFIKVLDFGLAKMQVSGGLRLTQTGMVLGTPDYMSPEQARGRETDHRTDIYAAGVMMYELLCGRVPFEAKTFQALRQKHLLEPPEPPSKWAPDAGITHGMDAIALRALAKDPGHRFASMDEMREAIEAVGTGKGAVELVERHTMPLLAERSVLDTPAKGGTKPMRIPRPEPVAPTVALRPNEPPPGQAPGQATVRASSEPARKHPGVAVGVALLLTALVLGGITTAYVVGWTGEPGPEQPRAPMQAAAPRPTPTEISLRFDTNVPVVVLDAEGRAPWGEQPTSELTMAHDDDALRLVLHADGYRELHVVVTPDRDQILEAELAPLPPEPEPSETETEAETEAEPGANEPEPTPEPRAQPRPKPVTKPAPEPEPKPEPDDGPPDETDDRFSPEIVNPFDKNKGK